MALADMKVSILQINTRKPNDNDLIVNLKFTCKDIGHFNSVVARMRGINHVNSVIRAFN